MLSPAEFLSNIARVEPFFMGDEVNRHLPTLGAIVEQEFADEVVRSMGDLSVFEVEEDLEDRIYRVVELLSGLQHNLPPTCVSIIEATLTAKAALLRWGIDPTKASEVVAGFSAPTSRMLFGTKSQIAFDTSDGPKVVPVIHVKSVKQVLDQAAIALEAGADGLFLVDHGASEEVVRDSLRNLACYTGYLPDPELGAPWVGLNMLGGIPRGADYLQDINAVWTDDLPTYRRAVRHFAGVMFKHQRQRLSDATDACNRGFIPTTSGPATGSAPSVDHARRVRENMSSDAPLAVASGLTPDNVGLFKGLVDFYMVATGVSKDFYTFDPGAMRAFVAAAKS